MGYEKQRGTTSKRWRWTEEDAAMVDTLAGAGFSAQRVADALGCDAGTLTRRYDAGIFATGTRGKKPTSFTEEQREQIVVMAGHGIPHAEIAAVMATSLDALHEHFRAELATASVAANSRVAGFLFSQAEKGSTSAAIFWLKCRAGWKEITHVELGVSGSIDLSIAGTLDTFTTEELIELRAMARRADMHAVEELTA